jgi:hypothetical protein
LSGLVWDLSEGPDIVWQQFDHMFY